MKSEGMLPNAQGNRKRDKLLKGVTTAASSAAAAAGSVSKRTSGAKNPAAAESTRKGSHLP